MSANRLIPPVLTAGVAIVSMIAMTTCALTGDMPKADMHAAAINQLKLSQKTESETVTTVPATIATTKPTKPTEPPTEPEVPWDASEDAQAVMEAARDAVRKCTRKGMTMEEKLYASFHYLKDNYLEGVRRDTYTGPDWPVVYAKDLLIDGKGDCFSFGASFAYMAKAIGYEEVYACNSGGHGWTEIDGKLYDPEWATHSDKYSYYGMSYDEPCDVAYGDALGDEDWMHVKV
ncbi:MAG: transglutaminase domain-containing protein [Ruminococcus sp.]|nr:transglutaminase domain-containing protein [Ruminococcus sp.]MBQ1380530.1 transglutaminase domain-containing protein [Ruminococcus sp.]MBQ1601240.1 transglutaminase domain-containing protein [Ruminococcus sp.]MBQ1687614.1 transglutaminase domain-containing protein [Ruminococcus sp.]MBQ1806139.1 transglutaminase domain-containing protein [Ruminococcus sp.]